MPLLIGAGRVREEGHGKTVAAVWRKRPEGFTNELEPYQRDRLRAEAGRRHLMRFPGLVAPLNTREISVISKILGEALERVRRSGGGR